MPKKSISLADFLMVFAMILVVVIGRIMPHAPNFTPIAAVGLFAGFFFKKRAAVMLIPVAGMLVTDLLFLGTYGVKMMIFIYVGLAIPALFGKTIHKVLNGTANTRMGTLKRIIFKVVAVSGIAALGSFIFTVLSNFGVWAFSGMYPHTIEGFVTCYVNAVPFHINTLAGDLFYIWLFTGSYYAVTAIRDARKPGTVLTIGD